MSVAMKLPRLTASVAATTIALFVATGANAETYEIKVPLASSSADYSSFQSQSGLQGAAATVPFQASCSLHSTKADAATGANAISSSVIGTANCAMCASFGSNSGTVPIKLQTAANAPVADGWRCVMEISGTTNRVGSFIASNQMQFTTKDCLYGSFQPGDAGAYCQ